MSSARALDELAVVAELDPLRLELLARPAGVQPLGSAGRGVVGRRRRQEPDDLGQRAEIVADLLQRHPGPLEPLLAVLHVDEGPAVPVLAPLVAVVEPVEHVEQRRLGSEHVRDRCAEPAVGLHEMDAVPGQQARHLAGAGAQDRQIPRVHHIAVGLVLDLEPAP